MFKCTLVSIVLFATLLVFSVATGPTHDRVVVCYWGSWSVYRKDRAAFAIENLDPSLCTHIIYSFAGLNVTGDAIRPLDPWQDLTENYGKGGYQRITSLRERYPHLKVSIAIGGWTEGSTNYSRLAADATRRNRFVANAVDFIRKYRFDGLDLDWEFPGKRGGTPDDKLNFLLLVKELRAAFRKYNFLLTAAFGAGKDTIDGGYDVEGLAIYLDYIHMMCYDYHGTWDRKTGPNAPLRSTDVLNVEYSIDYMIKLGAPPSKLVMGIPLYGRTFILEEPFEGRRKPVLGTAAKEEGFHGPYLTEKGFMGYNEICIELRNDTWKKYWDEKSRTPFAISGNRLISYDSEQSIFEKIQFAMERGLAGAMVWSIDTDDFHGDCSKEDGEDFINFPLMKCINKSIIQSLKDLENRIPQNDPDPSAVSRVAASKLVLFSILVVVYSLL